MQFENLLSNGGGNSQPRRSSIPQGVRETKRNGNGAVLFRGIKRLLLLKKRSKDFRFRIGNMKIL
jgi:hypothetical protein